MEERARSLLGLVAVPSQLALILGSAVTFEALSRPATLQAVLPEWVLAKYKALSKKDARDLEIAFASTIHALITSLVSLTVILAPDSGVGIGELSRLYGYSSRAQAMFGVSSGFFLWDLFTLLSDRSQFDWGFLLHGIVCFSVYILGQFPVFHYYGSGFLLFELSTPFLNLRKALLAMGEKGSPLFAKTEQAFGLAFFVVRLVFGVPMSLFFLRDVVNLLRDERRHNKRALQFFLLANISMCALNVYWFRAMWLKAKRKAGAGKKKPGDGGDVGAVVDDQVAHVAGAPELATSGMVTPADAVGKKVD